MDTLVGHIDDYMGLYTLLVILLLGVGSVFAVDVVSARRRRTTNAHGASPDHTRTVHTIIPGPGWTNPARIYSSHRV